MSSIGLRHIGFVTATNGERVTIVLGPRSFEAAQEEAGHLIVWLGPDRFRFRNVTVRRAPQLVPRLGETGIVVPFPRP